MAGLQCHKQLWWRSHEPDAPELIPDAAQQAIFDQGRKVGEVARTYVPGGQLIDLPHYAIAERVAATARLLKEGVDVIYEGSFLANDVYAAVDILEHAGGGFRMIEVKSSTSVKDEHVPDVGIQLHVLRKNGIEVSHAEVMHLNRECSYPRLEGLFVRQDITAGADALQGDIPALIAGQLRMLAGPIPEISTGDHCKKPWDCPFMNRCWGSLPKDHVSTLYRVRQGGADLVAKGFDTIGQLPSNIGLSAIQDRQRRAVNSGQLIVEPGLGDALRVFAEPLAVLDFETIGLAIPVWDGCHPYDAIPVQFSCDRVDPGGVVIHHEWIAEGPGDPRPELARYLVDACRGARTVVAYNAGFEKGCLERLAAGVPKLATELLEIAGKLADPLPVLREYIYHPAFGGSFSLKAVLPALVPDLAYEGLEIADGSTASLELVRLIFEGDSIAPEERQRVRNALLRYCALDTMAVVKLLERMRELEGGT